MKSYQQDADHTCGAACVRDLQDYFGLKVLSERTLAKKLCANRERGIEPWRIEAYLREIGLQAEYVRDEKFGRLVRRNCQGWRPMVVWADWGGHYCIIESIEVDLMVLVDPAAIYEGRPGGHTATSVARFKSMWFCPIDKAQREVIYVKGPND